MRRVRAAYAAAVLTGMLAVVTDGVGAQVGSPGFQPVNKTGSAQSGPDAAGDLGPTARWVVVRGTDNGIYITQLGVNGPWFGLGAPPGGAQGDPTIVSWAPGRLDVFVRGMDDKLWQIFQTSSGGIWSQWIQPVGDQGTLDSGPEASSRGPGRIDVFVRGTDGQVYQRYYENNAWNQGWIGHGDPPGAVTVVGEPTSVSRDGVVVDVFVRGSDDKLWQKHWSGSAWSDWIQPVGNQGTITSSPDAGSYAPYNIAVFARGTDNGVWWLDFRTAGWSNWFRVGNPGDVIQDGPGVVTDTLFVTVVGRGTDNLVYQFSTGLDGEMPQP